MITLKNITLRNFLSIGQITQAINFDTKELTLILGENLDLGGDGARNGTGKTTLIQGLSYVLFGLPINKIRKDNLVNRTNGKGMMVTLDFTINGIDYKIERGRKPNVLRYFVNDVQQKSQDDAQGENKETQAQIDRTLGMSADMFRHIVALNTYSEPFLALATNEQKKIIEQLLGVTLLSEKAEVIKNMLKSSKDMIQIEEFRVKAVEEANVRVKEQIESLRRRQKLWIAKHDSDLNALALEYDSLATLDVEAELLAHKELAQFFERSKKAEVYNALVARHVAWETQRNARVSKLNTDAMTLRELDINKELAAHKKLAEFLTKQTQITAFTQEKEKFNAVIKASNKAIVTLTKEIKSLEDHKCYACGQEVHDATHDELLNNKRESLLEFTTSLNSAQSSLESVEAELASIGKLGKKPATHYKTEAEAIRHSSDISNLEQTITGIMCASEPYAEQLADAEEVIVGAKPLTHYDNETEAVEHRSKMSSLLNQIQNKSDEADPYSEQIVEMEKNAVQEVSFDMINKLTKIAEHQKFLYDLLSSRDSFVRKKIIDQNLSYLNSRLTHYLDKIGLPHQVVFKNDLEVEITELGRDLDFDNLSRGERNRLILGLSFAFRDVWENLYSPINLLFIDELIDSGLDTMGVENSLAILKDMSRRRQKSIWLVSHREELAGRVPRVLKVIKQGGFTSVEAATDAE